MRAVLRRHGLVRRPRPLRRFLRTQRLRFTNGNRLRLFASGDAGLAAMLEAIRSARRRVHLESYIFRTDATGRAFIDALESRARAGVDVRVLYDAVGSIGLDLRAFDGLRAAGADVVAFNPLRRFYPHWLPRRRDHRKILVVDGRIGFTGGLNIGDEYNAGPADDARSWRDTHVQVVGPAVRDLEGIFLESWFRADAPDLPWGQMLEPSAEQPGGERCAVVPDGPAYRRRVVRDLLVAGLASATSEASLTSPYFAPDRKVLGAMGQAAERGVKVTLMLAGRTDHPILRRAARALLPRLIESGVLIYEYTQSMLHAKATVFDEGWAVVGTSNLDRQSFEHSYEVNLVIEGGPIPGELSDMFEQDLQHATRVDTTALEARGPFERLVDRLAALLLLFI